MELGVLLMRIQKNWTGDIEPRTGRRAIALATPLILALLFTVNVEAEGLAREAQIQADIASLEREATSYGGWPAWQERGEAFRLHFTELMNDPGRAKVLRGRNNFLFSAYDITFLSGEDLVYRSRADGTKTTSPVYDAVTELAGQLDRRGIDLIFVPVPARFEIYPENIPDAPPTTAPLATNRKFLLYNLLRANVECVDLVPSFVRAKAEQPRGLFHPANRHWADGGVRTAARIIAERLARYSLAELDPEGVETFTVRTASIPAITKIAEELPREQREAYYEPKWSVQTVAGEDGAPYTPREGSPVLIVGDSFVGHLSFLSAGISAHVSRHIGFPVDEAWSSGGGPQVPRMIARKGSEFLEGRKVVVWVMSTRYLPPYFDDLWSPVKLP